jgi:hypothetical protein
VNGKRQKAKGKKQRQKAKAKSKGKDPSKGHDNLAGICCVPFVCGV